jgi:hypothetical protein
VAGRTTLTYILTEQVALAAQEARRAGLGSSMAHRDSPGPEAAANSHRNEIAVNATAIFYAASGAWLKID